MFDRTLANLRSAWREIAGSARGVLTGAPRPDLPDDDAARLHQQMLACLDASGGEVAARARAADLGRTYLALNPAGRERFVRLLAEDFDTDHEAVNRCCAALSDAEEPAERRDAERALRAALLPPRVNLLRHFNSLPEGVKFLVDLRAEVIDFAGADPAMRGLSEDMREFLGNWFDIGFLELRRITWEASASLLEKLIAYEAVHEIRGWTDLKNRLEADRRCFAFFHPRMPDEPLIFVEVALVNGHVGEYPGPTRRGGADRRPAIGRHRDLLFDLQLPARSRRDQPRRLPDQARRRCARYRIAPPQDVRDPVAAAGVPDLAQCRDRSRRLAVPGERRGRSKSSPRAWRETGRDETSAPARQPHPGPKSRALRRRCATRCCGCARNTCRRIRRRDERLDPVAHFHLTNGARVERLDWLGDISPKGLQQSAGIMVNYLYRLDEIEANHAAYRESGKVAAASAVRNLLRAA